MGYGKAVQFNAGNLGGDADVFQFALVTKELESGNVNLVSVDAHGAWEHHNDVPRRDPADYGPEGGGDTYTSGPA